jgi:uncharacterized membrane protein
MEDWAQHILFTVMRWVHVVCTTLIVGGTLFFEFVVPIAIEDLKDEQQLAVFNKARWVFRRVVWIGSVLLLISGAVSIVRLWETYQDQPYRSSMWWAVGHIGLGIITLGIALLLTAPRRPPDHQVGWMQFNLVLLLVAIFAAGVSSHVRLVHDREGAVARERLKQLGQPLTVWGGSEAPTTGPTTRESR